MKRLSKHCSNCQEYIKFKNRGWGICEFHDFRIDDDNFVCKNWTGKKFNRRRKYDVLDKLDCCQKEANTRSR